MNQSIRKRICAGAAVLLMALSGCQEAPESGVVVSKNDGSFDKSVIQSAPENTGADAIQHAQYSETFYSTDNSVEFTLNLDQEIDIQANPVTEVVPHYLTGEDAQRIANILLEDAVFYEQRPLLDPDYSKKEIQDRLNRWSPFANVDALQELFGETADPEWALEIVKSFLTEYTELYQSAPDTQQTPCQWQLKKDAYYFDAPEDVIQEDAANDNDAIKATAKVGEVEYTFEVSTRNKDDYKINNIFLSLNSGTSPYSIDTRIYTAALCRTQEPTEADAERMQQKAEEMLSKMELGEWHVDSCTVETTYYGDIPEYKICVDAVPVINGAAALRQPLLDNLRSENAYASSYYHTEAHFEFSANGEIVYFRMLAPVDIKETVNANVAALGIDELIEQAKSHLMLSDYYQYGINAENLDYIQEEYEEILCKIDISKLEYGQLRVKVPNTDESYYYVPGLMLSGSVDYVGQNTGTVYEASGESFGLGRIRSLVALNAVDGSIIPLSND